MISDLLQKRKGFAFVVNYFNLLDYLLESSVQTDQIFLCNHWQLESSRRQNVCMHANFFLVFS